jgi:DNA replication protein DnaC
VFAHVIEYVRSPPPFVRRIVKIILTSQLPVAHWHEQFGDPTAADGILDRLVHNAHRIDMRGESMRKKRSTKPPD